MASSENSVSYQTSEEYFEEQLTTSLSDVFQGRIPEFVEDNREWLLKIESEFLCCLCDITIQTSIYYWKNRDNFDKHLSSEGHTNLLDYASEARNPPSNTYKTWEECIEDRLTELYGSYEEIPLYVKESMEYIGTSGCYLYCHLCNKYLQNSCLDEQIMGQMESHLKSQGHESLLYKGTDSYKTSAELYCLNIKDSLTSLFKGKLPDFVENCIDYIDRDDDDCNYYCRLCNKHLQVSQNHYSTVNNFKKHLLSSGHKYYLNKYVLETPKTALERYFARIHELLNINFNNSIPYDVNRCINYFAAALPNWFYCCLCKEYMNIFRTQRDVIRINNLKPHLNSRKHRQLLDDI